MGAVPRLVEMELTIEFLLFEIRQDQHAPTVKRLPRDAVHDGGWQPALRIVIIPQRKGQLGERSVRAIRRIANLLIAQQEYG